MRVLNRRDRVWIPAPPEYNPQFARPSSDVSDGSWTDQAGGTDLRAAIDETFPDEADYIRSSTSPPSADICEIALSSVTDPAASVDHIVRYRYAKSQSGGAQINLTVRLFDGGTQIAAWTHTDIDENWTEAAQVLSAGEANSIGNYADLRLKFEAIAP